MEKAVAPHSSTLAWGVPWTEEPGVLQSTGSQRVGHNLVTEQQVKVFGYQLYTLLGSADNVRVKRVSEIPIP